MVRTEGESIEALRGQLAEARRRAARIALINQVARLITSSLSSDEIFGTAVAAIGASFGFHYVAAGIVDPEDPTSLVLLAEAGPQAGRVPPGYRQSIDVGLVGRAARERRRVLINDLRAEPGYLPTLGDAAISAELVTPIIVGDRLMGVINIESLRPIELEEAESVEIIAEQFGAALENLRLVGGLQQALDATRLLFEVSQRLGAAMSVEQVVEAYLGAVAARGPYICTVALYDFDHAERRAGVVVQGYWTPETGTVMGQRRVPYTRDALDPPLDAGETITIADVRSDPRVSPELLAHQLASGRPALAFIPLIVRGRRFGLVILSHSRVYEWPAAELRLYQTTASQLASAIDSRLQHGLAAEGARQVAVLEERRRLARELHDSVTQSLFSMSLLAQILPELWAIDRDEARASLGQIRDLTRGALAEMRELLFELRPTDAEAQDLTQSLRTRAAAFQRRSGVPAQVVADGPLQLPTEQAQAMLRIAQEALTNIDHHAGARAVRLTLCAGPPVTLRIADDGRGFDPAHSASGRLGLISMRERAAALGAALTIASAPGQGTTVTITLAGDAGATEEA